MSSIATLTISQEVVNNLFQVLLTRFHMLDEHVIQEQSGAHPRISSKFGLRLKGGWASITADGLQVNDLDLIWDPMSIFFEFDIPPFVVGGHCLLEFGGECILEAPRITLFERNPDIALEMSLGGLLSTKLMSLDCLLSWQTAIHADPKRTIHENHLRGAIDQLELHLEPLLTSIGIRFIDVAKSGGEVVAAMWEQYLDQISDQAPEWVRGAFGFFFDWIRQLVETILSPLNDLDGWLAREVFESPSFSSVIARGLASFFSIDGSAVLALPRNYPIADASQADHDLPVLLPLSPLPVRCVPGTELIVSLEAV